MTRYLLSLLCKCAVPLNTFVMLIIRSVMQKDNLGVLQYVSYGGALAIIAMSLYSFNPINDQ